MKNIGLFVPLALVAEKLPLASKLPLLRTVQLVRASVKLVDARTE